MLVLKRAVAFFPSQLHEHLHRLVFLAEDVGCPGAIALVPVVSVVFGMRCEVISTRQHHILVALCETIFHQSQHCDVIANARRQC
mgnify:CR=1 FL=1